MIPNSLLRASDSYFWWSEYTEKNTATQVQYDPKIWPFLVSLVVFAYIFSSVFVVLDVSLAAGVFAPTGSCVLHCRSWWKVVLFLCAHVRKPGDWSHEWVVVLLRSQCETYFKKLLCGVDEKTTPEMRPCALSKISDRMVWGRVHW